MGHSQKSGKHWEHMACANIFGVILFVINR